MAAIPFERNGESPIKPISLQFPLKEVISSFLKKLDRVHPDIAYEQKVIKTIEGLLNEDLHSSELDTPQKRTLLRRIYWEGIIDDEELLELEHKDLLSVSILVRRRLRERWKRLDEVSDYVMMRRLIKNFSIFLVVVLIPLAVQNMYWKDDGNLINRFLNRRDILDFGEDYVPWSTAYGNSFVLEFPESRRSVSAFESSGNGGSPEP